MICEPWPNIFYETEKYEEAQKTHVVLLQVI